MKMLNAHFDGKFIVLDEPAQLKTNARVKVVPLDSDAEDRVTNVEPLPDDVLDRTYSQPERDEAGIERLTAAQCR